MTKVYSKALRESLNVDRVIDQIEGNPNGPTLIFIAGIHGNEPSGVFALNRVMEELKESEIIIDGNIFALSGNMWALENGVRFHKEDLNRIWTAENIAKLSGNGTDSQSNDRKEQKELLAAIRSILSEKTGPFYFFDLHTTSGETAPFLTVNDSMLNRKFTIQYPLPIILGIEEYLEGPILSYINELGYVSFGHEAGQHDDTSSIENHIAFIYLSLVFTHVVQADNIDYDHYYDRLARSTGNIRKIYEIYYRYKIRPEENFQMKPGYFNFQLVKKGEILAESDGKPIQTTHKGRIFMPLYQKQGLEGFFAIREIETIFLALSELFRKIKLDHMLTLLPGVKWASIKKDELIVNKQVAFFMAKQFFHLLGYRSRSVDQNHLILKNREAKARIADYSNTSWIR